MPIRPENKALYPPDWKAISHRIRFERAGGRCECTGECGRPAWHLSGGDGGPDGRCANYHGDVVWRRVKPTDHEPSKQIVIVLTTAHLNHDPTDCTDENLRAFCQGCHLHYDKDHHAETARATRAAAVLASGQGLLDLR